MARTTTKPEPVPAGEPAPTPAEEVQPDPSPAPPPAPTAEELDERAARPARTAAEMLADPFGFRAAQAAVTAANDVPFPLSVGEAIAEVTRRIDAIPKARRATGAGANYAFRGIDDALAALHPLLGEVGLVILPGQVVREVWETRATSSGGTLNVARLLVRYTFVGPDGSTLPAEAWGEAGDSGDKATQKAHSQSYKTLVFQAFSIPTEASAADEPDLTNEPARPFTPDEVERAGRALRAALDAPDLPHLVGVRQRAVELLAVPTGTGGAVAPLSFWLEQRRQELVRAAEGSGA
jgi:hypothetical protein